MDIKNLKTGDIIFFGVDEKFPSNAQEIFQQIVRKVDGEFSHVEMVYSIKGDVMKCLGSQSTGAKFRKIKQQPNFRYGRILNNKTQEEMQKIMVEYYKNIKNYKYDWLGWLDSGINAVLKKINKNYNKKPLFKRKSDPKICSELVSELENLFQEKIILGESVTTPNDLWKFKKILRMF